MSETDIVKEFLVESRENLDRLDRDLVGLEKNPKDKEALAGVFRTIHTIKGTCGFLGFNKLEKVAHVGENLLTRLRDGQLTLNPELTTALLGMVDAVRQMLTEIDTTGQDGEIDYPELRETLTRLQTPATGIVSPSPSSIAAVSVNLAPSLEVIARQAVSEFPPAAAATAAGALVVDLDSGLTGSGVLIPQTSTAPGDFTGSASNYAFGGQAFGNFGEIDFAGVGGFTAGAFSGTGLLSDPFFGFGPNAANAGVTFTGAPLADTTPAESTTGRYTMFTFNTTPNPLVVTVVPGAPVDFDVVIYQASGTQAFMLNEGVDSVFLGPIEQQGATVNPLVKKRAAKAAKTKRK